MENCIFCKIVSGKIPADKVYEDEEIVIFKDIDPRAPVHLLCVHKDHYAHLTEMDEARAAMLGRSIRKIASMAESFGLKNGYRLVINQGEDAGQTVMHLHIHVLGGEQMLFM